ncbi:MAG: 8-oxo-dGTP diphosphatase [Anaerolineales bacterium]|nr:8-oxo-dGTP diphosphatase [Anaerolineales bacterium]
MPILPPLTYTLCFLTRADDVLLLHRRHPPNRGLWNGVGGRLEPGEAPLAGVLREVREETGYVLPFARFRGVLTWEGYEVPPGGLYLFTAEAPASPGDPRPCDEGDLAWHPRAWVLTAPEVVSNLHRFGAAVLGTEKPAWHHCRYQAGQLTTHEQRPLPSDLLARLG